METLIVKPTTKTPVIKFDMKNGRLEISGKSIPENAAEFYKPLKEYLARYIEDNKALPTQVDIYLEYFNTASSKYLLDVFRLLEVFYYRGNKVTVNWYYEEDDDDMYAAGEDYKALVTLPFNLCMKKIEIEFAN